MAQIEHNVNLSHGTKDFVLRYCNVALYQDNNKLYEIADLLRALTDNVIGVNKRDLVVLNNLHNANVKYINL